MSDLTTKKKRVRPSKGQRKHIRRLKQAARKEANPNNPQPSRTPQPVRAPQNRDQA